MPVVQSVFQPNVNQLSITSFTALARGR